MNIARLGKLVFLCLALFTIAGCKAKQDKPGAASPGKAAAVAPATPQDQTDARAAAKLVLSHLLAGDFAKVYQDASPEFKKIGPEAQFIAKFQQTRQKVGVLKNPRETSFATLPDRGHVLVYRVDNDLYNTDVRLTFARAQNGKMVLAGLNQHDELKK